MDAWICNSPTGALDKPPVHWELRQKYHETGGMSWSDCIYFLPIFTACENSFPSMESAVGPKMFSHGCPMVTVAGWSCPWWWYHWPRHCGNRGKASGRCSAGGLNPSPETVGDPSGFEIWNFKNDILGEPIHTMHTYCWVVCFFFQTLEYKAQGPSRTQSLCWYFFTDLQQTLVFLHLTKFEKKHITSYKNTCEKIWAIIHGYATYPCLIPGGYVGVGRLTRHESSQSSPSYYPGMWAFISPLPCRTFREHLPDLGGSWAHTTCCGRELQGSLPGNGGWLGSWWPVVFSSSRNWWVIDGNSGVRYLSNWKPGFLWI